MTEIQVTDIRDKIKTMKFQDLSPHLYNFIDDIPDLMSVQLVGWRLFGFASSAGTFQLHWCISEAGRKLFFSVEVNNNKGM